MHKPVCGLVEPRHETPVVTSHIYRSLLKTSRLPRTCKKRSGSGTIPSCCQKLWAIHDCLPAWVEGPPSRHLAVPWRVVQVDSPHDVLRRGLLALALFRAQLCLTLARHVQSPPPRTLVASKAFDAMLILMGAFRADQSIGNKFRLRCATQ